MTNEGVNKINKEEMEETIKKLIEANAICIFDERSKTLYGASQLLVCLNNGAIQVSIPKKRGSLLDDF